MRRALLPPWRTPSPQRSKKYRSPPNAWNVSAPRPSRLPAARNVSSKPSPAKLRYGKDPGRQLKSPVTTIGRPPPELRRPAHYQPGPLRAGEAAHVAEVRVQVHEREIGLGIRNFARFAERTTLVPQAEECFSGDSLSQNPPQSSNSSRAGSKRIALNS
jgi:hypothetical protein